MPCSGSSLHPGQPRDAARCRTPQVPGSRLGIATPAPVLHDLRQHPGRQPRQAPSGNPGRIQKGGGHRMAFGRPGRWCWFLGSFLPARCSARCWPPCIDATLAAAVPRLCSRPTRGAGTVENPPLHPPQQRSLARSIRAECGRCPHPSGAAALRRVPAERGESAPPVRRTAGCGTPRCGLRSPRATVPCRPDRQ